MKKEKRGGGKQYLRFDIDYYKRMKGLSENEFKKQKKERENECMYVCNCV